MTYEIDDKIGRSDSRDKIQITPMTVTSVHQLVPPLPLGRRNYIKIKNEGAVDVAVVLASGITSASGYIIKASGGEFEDNTDAVMYIVSTGAGSNVRVYERSERFNYKR